MKLTQLRVSQFQQFSGSLSISDFGPGLNLLCGPNESGKSTLVRAIRAAFFERHSASTLTDLRPWGDTGAAPEVELAFIHNDQQWQLNKRFLQRKRCDLTVAGKRYSGDEAEEQLAALLGYSVSTRGASKAEQWGVPGLLWIEQGLGQELKEPVTHAGDHLKSVLGASLSEVTSSSGDQIIRQVRSQLDELHTSTGKPRAAYKNSLERLAELDVQLQELDRRITSYQQQVDRLGELRQQQSADETARPWETLRIQQQAAEQRYAELDQLAQAQQRELKALEQLGANRQLVMEQLHHFASERAELKQRQATCQQLQQQLSGQSAVQGERINQRDAALAAYQQAQQQERLARQLARRQTLERETAQLEQQRQQLQASLQHAQQLQAELQRQQQAFAAVSVSQAALTQLEGLHQRLRELDIRRESIATRLQFDLLPGQAFEIDGAQYKGQGEQLLLQQAQISLADLGTLTITPGGQDLAELLRQHERTTEQCQLMLAELRVESLAVAQQQVAQGRTLQADIQANTRLLQSHAPDGVAALEHQLALGQARNSELQGELQALPAVIDSSVPTPETAEQLLQQASGRLTQAEQSCVALNETLIQQRQTLAHAEQECQLLQQRLADPQRGDREQQLNGQLLTLRAEEQRMQQMTAERAAVIEQARPDIIEQDIRRFAASAQQLEKDYATRKEQLIALQAGLQSESADGLEEIRAALAAERQVEARRSAEFERRARALSLLNALLTEQRQQLTRQLQAPLQQRLDHYLQLLFPQATLEVDEHLLPGRLLRHGQEAGDFEALSFGAREQMGLISRLAYADLLRDAGKPTLIILDDALVHSDQLRLEQMKRILFDAAQRHQVLLFSCHPDRWRDMGVPVRELEQLKAASSV